MASVSEVLARTLRDAGIDTVFGLPGGENADVLDSMRSEGLDFVLVRTESSGIFMADAHARLTGGPAVALATLGPGATNAYCGMAHAFLDRSPVVLVAAESDQRTLDSYTHQVIDLESAFKPVTKVSKHLTDVDTRSTLESALQIAIEGRPGPVHIGVSAFMASREASDSGGQGYRPAVTSSLNHVDDARSFLAAAERPAIVVGLGLEPEKPYKELLRLAEAAQAPVIVTPKAKGAISDQHPLSAGTFGLTQTDPPYQILDEADCIVAVGFDVVEMERHWDQSQPIIWVAPWQNEDPQLDTVAHEIVGPMGPPLLELAGLRPRPATEWGAKRVEEQRRSLKESVLPEPSSGRMRPQDVLSILRDHTPRDSVVTTDVGSHKICAGLTWPTYEPNTYLLSNGLSAMGFGLPAAIAAARATGQMALCIIGDGGIAMTQGELGLLRELELPVVVVVMSDNALDLIRSAQIRRGKPVYGTEFVNPDFEHIARAYGIDHQIAYDQSSCSRAIQKAVAAMKPVLIEAHIDPVSYPTTPQNVGRTSAGAGV